MSCYNCTYQTLSRTTDFTLWDCWETLDVAPEWNDNKGTTNVVAWTEKADKLLTENSENVNIKEYPIEKAGGIKRTNQFKPKQDRDIFFKDANEMDINAFFNKYTPYTFKIRLKQALRFLLLKFHFHNVARRVKHYIIHR